MTTVAWDGKTLAADKQATNNGYGVKVTKIWKLNTGVIMAASGDLTLALELRYWLESGGDPSKFPPKQRTADFTACMLAYPDGKLYKLEDGPIPFEVESAVHAMGSGRDFALAAMYLGKSAVEAIEVASALDHGTGKGVDSFTV